MDVFVSPLCSNTSLPHVGFKSDLPLFLDRESIPGALVGSSVGMSDFSQALMGFLNIPHFFLPFFPDHKGVTIKRTVTSE